MSTLHPFRVPVSGMADQELREILTEFQNLAESEHHSFLSTIVHNFSYSNSIFGALVLFEVNTTHYSGHAN